MIRKGDVWVGAGSGFASKPRPMVVLQSEEKSVTDTLVVVLATSVERAEPGVRYFIPATIDNGLIVDSFAMIDKITPIPKSGFAKKIGEITRSQLIEIERLLIKMIDVDKSELEEIANEL